MMIDGLVRRCGRAADDYWMKIAYVRTAYSDYSL
jgi:hypothetical protein